MCMVDDSDGSALVLRERRPRARTTHRCGECFRTILPGERYLAESFVSDGHFGSHKTCAHCEVAREWLWCECGGIVYGGISEDVSEHAASGLYGFGVARLAAGMRHKWTRRNGALWTVPRLPAGATQRVARA